MFSHTKLQQYRISKKVLNEICDPLGIKRLFSHPFHPQGNARVENVHNFSKMDTHQILRI